MAESTPYSSSSSSALAASSSPPQSSRSLFIKSLLVPILAAALFMFWIDPFDPAPAPIHELGRHKPPMVAPRVNSRMLRESVFVGSGQVSGPEDLVYDHGSRVIYTGCDDGWVKRVKLGESGLVTESEVEDWVNTGGRPLGLAIASHDGSENELIVADANKGLLKINNKKEIELLTNEVEGLAFKLTDGVAITKGGMIYFTDASYKYVLEDYLYDILESRPYGRLLSFDPNSGETKVLLRDLYFPNGVALSPDQNSLIFCETPLKRCRRYWLQGSKKGSVDAFVDNLPGYPDNIHYDGQSDYLIAISSKLHPFLEKLRMYQVCRKSMAILNRYISLHFFQKFGGVLSVDLEGNPIAHFYDRAMSHITSGTRAGDHLYIGSLHYSHIIRFNLTSQTNQK